MWNLKKLVLNRQRISKQAIMKFRDWLEFTGGWKSTQCPSKDSCTGLFMWVFYDTGSVPVPLVHEWKLQTERRGRQLYLQKKLMKLSPLLHLKLLSISWSAWVLCSAAVISPFPPSFLHLFVVRRNMAFQGQELRAFPVSPKSTGWMGGGEGGEEEENRGEPHLQRDARREGWRGGGGGGPLHKHLALIIQTERWWGGGWRVVGLKTEGLLYVDTEGVSWHLHSLYSHSSMWKTILYSHAQILLPHLLIECFF